MDRAKSLFLNLFLCCFGRSRQRSQDNLNLFRARETCNSRSGYHSIEREIERELEKCPTISDFQPLPWIANFTDNLSELRRRSLHMGAGEVGLKDAV
jgi:hypothetical protein